MIDLTDPKWIVAIIASIIAFGNLAYYLVAINNGRTKPHLYTWLIWGIVTVVVAYTQFSSKGGAGSMITAIIAFNCFAIALLAFFKGEKEFTTSDKLCLAGCIVSIAIWPIFKAPLLSLVMVTIIDTLGFYPTLRKSYKSPHQENIVSFSIYGFTYFLSMFALEKINVLTSLYPIAISSTAFLLVGFLMIRRHQLGHKVLTWH